jgi:hypothetical protein
MRRLTTKKAGVKPALSMFRLRFAKLSISR